MERTLYCPKCEQERLFQHEQRRQAYDVRGEQVVLTVPLWVCGVCGETIVDDQFGDPIEKAFDTYRQKHGLLKPAEIQGIRQQWNLSQAAFAALLGMSQATINRYERGSLHQAKEDELIRACAQPEHVAGLLERRGHALTARQRRAAEAALKASPVAGFSDAWSGSVEAMPSEASVRSGFRRFDFDRFAAVVVWLCGNIAVVTQTKLYKLLFYADFLCFRATSRSLTGALYRQMQYGPVPVAYEWLRARLEAEDIVQVLERTYDNGRTGEEFLLGPRASQVRMDFGEDERRVLDFVRRQLGGMAPSVLSETSHQETAWRDTPPKEIISYEKAMELSLSPRDEQGS